MTRKELEAIKKKYITETAQAIGADFDFYKPRIMCEIDENGKYIGESLFIVRGQMADGSKVWHKFGADGEILEDAFYLVYRCGGRMCAVLEGYN